jgi:hypothetical protein
MSIPRNLKYDNSKQSAYARSYTSNLMPQQAGPYTGGSTITLNVPCTQMTVLAAGESVLKYDLEVTNGGTAAAYMRLGAAGGHGPIRRLRIYHGSNLIEDIDNYSTLVSKLMPFQQSGDSFAGKQSVLCGTSSDYAVQMSLATAASIADEAAVETAIQTYKVRKVKRVIAGERLVNAGAADEFAAIAANGLTAKRTYTINLMSILGSLSTVYLPLYAMAQSGIPLRLELQLHDDANKFINSPQVFAGFEMTNIEYIASYIELGTDAMSMVNQHAGSEIKFSTTGWRNYSYTATRGHNTADEFHIAVPAKFSSLKGLFLTSRSKSAGAVTFHADSSNDFYLAEYNLRMGSKVVPAKAPKSIPEFFVSVLQALGSLSDLNHEPAIDIYNYSEAVPVANAETSLTIHSSAGESQFMIGVDLESFSGANPDSLFQGANTSNDDIHWILKYTSFALPGNAAVPVRFDSYAMFDQVVIVESGLMSVIY